MKILLTVAVTLALAAAAFFTVSYFSEETSRVRPDTDTEREDAPDDGGGEETQLAKITELKSQIPDDDFCRIVNGEVEAGASNLFANGSDRYKKYALFTYGETVAPPTVVCPLRVDTAGTVAYARLVPNVGDESVTVEVYNAGGNLRQTLFSRYPSSMVWSLLVRDDVDFDGYRDALLTDSAGASNQIQSYYTYDPASGTFAPREDLAELSNLKFDSQARTIGTFAHGSAVTGSSATLSLIGNRYVITKMVSVDYYGDYMNDASRQLVEVTKELKDGVLATTSVTYKTF